MKNKISILTVVLILTVITTNAQLQFGVKTGINLSTQSEIGMLWDNNDIKTGFTIGAIIDYRFHNTLSIQTEVNYKTEGLAYEHNEIEGKRNVNNSYEYYNIPLLVKGRFNEQLGVSNQWLVSLYMGSYYSYLRSAESEIKVGSTATVTDSQHNSNNSDWGMILEGEVAKVFNKGEVFLILGMKWVYQTFQKVPI